MKTTIAIMLLSLTTSVFAQGSWTLSCESAEGITFSSDNGISEIQLSRADAPITIEIENYNLNQEILSSKVKLVGTQKVLDEQYENSCNKDQVKTTFSQQAEIILEGHEAQTVDVVCHDEVITTSSAESDDCLN